MKLFNILNSVLFNRLPDLPALNKWLKQFTHSCWWLIGICLLVTPTIFLSSQSGRIGGGQIVFTVDQLMGPADTDAVKAINKSRSRKNNTWLHNMPLQSDILATATLLYKIVRLALFRTVHVWLAPPPFIARFQMSELPNQRDVVFDLLNG